MDVRKMNVRPYELMCLICRYGRQSEDLYYFDKKLDMLQKVIQKDRYMPFMLRCNVESTFRFQNPGHRHDTPEGKLFNISRDLNIIQRLGLLPGSIIPAIDIIELFINSIGNTDSICSFGNDAVSCGSCKFAKSGNYERGIKTVCTSLIKLRPENELSVCKKNTSRKLYNKKCLNIRPHHLLCLACTAGDKKNEEFKYYKENHLFEIIEICRNNPNILIKLSHGPDMICAPCSGYSPHNGLCAKSFGIGLRDQKKDIDVLHAAGLNYGDIIPAYKLFNLLFARIFSTVQICGFSKPVKTGPAWRICGGENNLDGNPEYKKARNLGLMIPGVNPAP